MCKSTKTVHVVETDSNVKTPLFSAQANSLLLLLFFVSVLEIAKLTLICPQDVTVHLKLIFSWFLLLFFFPFSDDCPRYSSQVFAAAYGFTHITSSPGFAQSNREAECCVQTVKILFKNTEDPCLALLAYRATPLAAGYSPVHLLMSRILRTSVPQHPTLLTSVLPDSIIITAKRRENSKKDTTRFYNRNHGGDLSQLTPGQPVWITDTESQGTAVSSHSTKQSYIVDGTTGTVMRNRHHPPFSDFSTLTWKVPSTTDSQELIWSYHQEWQRGKETTPTGLINSRRRKENENKDAEKKNCCFMFCCLHYLPRKIPLLSFESLDVLLDFVRYELLT